MDTAQGPLPELNPEQLAVLKKGRGALMELGLRMAEEVQRQRQLVENSKPHGKERE